MKTEMVMMAILKLWKSGIDRHPIPNLVLWNANKKYLLKFNKNEDLVLNLN